MAKIGNIEDLRKRFHKTHPAGQAFRKEFLDGVYALLKKHNIKLTDNLVIILNADGDGGAGAKFP